MKTQELGNDWSRITISTEGGYKEACKLYPKLLKFRYFPQAEYMTFCAKPDSDLMTYPQIVIKGGPLILHSEELVGDWTESSVTVTENDPSAN